eukprot:Opistho-1_new@94216
MIMHKKLTYFLLIIVLSLWGAIFYRIYNATAEEEIVKEQYNGGSKQYFKLVNHEDDKFLLILDYRNPFSEPDLSFSKENKVITNKPVLINKIDQKPTVQWPPINYLGYIINPANKQKVAIVRVAERELMMGEGDKVNGVKLIPMYSALI